MKDQTTIIIQTLPNGYIIQTQDDKDNVIDTQIAKTGDEVVTWIHDNIPRRNEEGDS